MTLLTGSQTTPHTAVRARGRGPDTPVGAETTRPHAGELRQSAVGLSRPISTQSKQSAGSGGGTASSPGMGLSHQIVSSTRWRILQPESVRTMRSW